MKILKGHSKMKTYLININNISKFTQRLLLGSLMLCAFVGQALGQSTDGQFVIKKDGHYLAHIKVGDTWKVKDIGAFHPDSCLWYSGRNFNPEGTNHNYYFYDGTNYRFLAPRPSSGIPTKSIISTTGMEAAILTTAAAWPEARNTLALRKETANLIGAAMPVGKSTGWNMMEALGTFRQLTITVLRKTGVGSGPWMSSITKWTL